MVDKYRKQAHSVYFTRYHLVFVTKYRRKIFRNNIPAYLIATLRKIAERTPDIELLEINTDIDHIHFLAIIPPKYAIADAVRILKANSARVMRKKFPFIRSMYEHENLGLWSDGYFVSTVGVNEGQIKRYIELQGQEDEGGAQLVML
jgi:putative transposase